MQTFEVEWYGGTLTPELIAALLIEYFDKMKWPRQTIIVKEIIEGTKEKS